MDLTTYIPGSMSSTDFYGSMLDDAISGAVQNYGSTEPASSSPLDGPAVKQHYYQGDITSGVVPDVKIEGAASPVQKEHEIVIHTYSDPSKWSPSERVLSNIKKWEGSSMRTNVPFSEVNRQFKRMTPNLGYLSDNQRDALYSYYYNLKPSTYARTMVPLLKNLNGYADSDTLDQIKSNINVGMNREGMGGLRKRRLAEQDMFARGKYAEGGNLYPWGTPVSGLEIYENMDAFNANTPGNITNVPGNFNLNVPSNMTSNAGMLDNFHPSVGLGLTKFYSGLTSGAGLSSGVKNFLGKPGVGGLVSAASGVVGGLIGGKNQSGVGNALGKAGDVVGMIPGPWGTIGNSALHVVGGLTNAAFGSNINKAFVNQTEQQSGKQLSWNSMAQSSDQLLNDAKNLSMLNNVNKSQVGSDGWFSHKASRETDRLNQKINEANDRAYSNLFNAADNISDNTSLGMMANYSAYGGPLNFTRDNVSYPHNYSWLAEGGPLKKVSDSQVMNITDIGNFQKYLRIKA